LVSKSGTTGSADKAVFGQLGGYPRALGLSSFMMLSLALLPGIPAIPFLLLAGLVGTLAWSSAKRNQDPDALEGEGDTLEDAAPVAEEPIANALQIDNLRLELGYGLLPMINAEGGQRLTDQIKALRRQLAQDMGFVLPSVRIQDNLQLPANSYVIRVKEIEAGRGELRPTMLLVMDPKGEQIPLSGEETKEPTFGLPAMWIDPGAREEALFRGYTVVDPPTVITTHLTELVKDNMSELLSYAETQKLLDELDEDQQKLTADLMPGQISVGGLQRVLQNLLGERISIRDLPTILEGVSEACGFTRNVTGITEHVRTRLARQISNAQINQQGFIPIITMSPEWEQAFAESITGEGEERQLSMAPSRLQAFIKAMRDAFERQAVLGEIPVLLTSVGIRPYVRSVVERFRPATPVLSQNEIHPKAQIKTLGQI
jgi:flagellar biosynthesis protein FlhA